MDNYDNFKGIEKFNLFRKLENSYEISSVNIEINNSWENKECEILYFRCVSSAGLER